VQHSKYTTLNILVQLLWHLSRIKKGEVNICMGLYNSVHVHFHGNDFQLQSITVPLCLHNI